MNTCTKATTMATTKKTTRTKYTHTKSLRVVFLLYYGFFLFISFLWYQEHTKFTCIFHITNDVNVRICANFFFFCCLLFLENLLNQVKPRQQQLQKHSTLLWYFFHSTSVVAPNNHTQTYDTCTSLYACANARMCVWNVSAGWITMNGNFFFRVFAFRISYFF